MKFCDKLNSMIDLLNCTNIDLSKASNVDPTIISRFKTGKRIPTQNSIVLNNLISGLCELAKKTHKEKEIRSLLELDTTSMNLHSAITRWFSSKDSNIRISTDSSTSLIPDNLNILMRSFNISNIELAKNINRDPSLISKYKNKTRILSINDDISNSICNFFVTLVFKRNKVDFFSSIIGCTEKISDEKELKEHLMHYLYSKEKATSPVNNFLEVLNRFKIPINNSLPSFKDFVAKKMVSSNKSNYFGTIGFRDAIRRFLTHIAKQQNPTILNLYSDESMQWLIQDKDFFNMWKLLMFHILSKKNKIIIIHNINRNLPEMFRAIEGWLPLYMTGLIEPYYCKKVLDNRFNHTLFLAQNLALIHSFSIRGTTNDAVYQYTTDKNILKKYEKQYAELLGKSAPLIKIFVNGDIENRLHNTTDYKRIKRNPLENIEILFKKDISTLVLKSDNPSILFEFEHPFMMNAFENYLDTFLS